MRCFQGSMAADINLGLRSRIDCSHLLRCRVAFAALVRTCTCIWFPRGRGEEVKSRLGSRVGLPGAASSPADRGEPEVDGEWREAEESQQTEPGPWSWRSGAVGGGVRRVARSTSVALLWGCGEICELGPLRFRIQRVGRRCHASPKPKFDLRTIAICGQSDLLSSCLAAAAPLRTAPHSIFSLLAGRLGSYLCSLLHTSHPLLACIPPPTHISLSCHSCSRA